MFKKLIVGSLAAFLVSLPLAAPAFASGFNTFIEGFNGSFNQTWYFTNYEAKNGQFSRNPGVMCGADACASLANGPIEQYLNVVVNPSTTAGIYTNTDISEVPLALPTSPDSGPWTPTVGHPISMESTVRWNSAYNYDGTGNAVGTNGVILWNSATDQNGPTPEYSSIGFSWVKNTAEGGYLAGLTANTVENLNPISVMRAASPVNINQWVTLRLLWSVNTSGTQSVQYFINGQSVGTEVLPAPLHNLSMEIWNDNQEPTFTANGLVTLYPSPSVQQAINVNDVRVIQL